MAKLIFLIPMVFIFIATTNMPAQNVEKGSWTTSVFLSPSLASSKIDWSFSHPIYNQAGGVNWETFSGTFEQSITVSGGAEMSKGHFGFQGKFDFMPQKLTKTASIKSSELNLLIGELSILFYPMKYNGKSIKPYAILGSGLLKATGDIDNTGYVLSYGAGIKIPFSGRLDMDLGLKGMSIKYTQLNLAESISKDIRIHPYMLFLGVFYRL